MPLIAFPEARRRKAKRAFTTRRVPEGDMKTLISGAEKPETGDLVLATVREIGKQKKLELPTGRRATMLPGDEILVCYGARYAPDQFEAMVSLDLGPCDLVAAGGVAGDEICRHDKMLAPTSIEPIGLVGDADGRRINIARYAMPAPLETRPIKVVLVAGTAMNSGKTFTAASLIHGFAQHGFSTAGVKSTGTGSGGDLWSMADHGADFVADFTDVGMASTYLQPDARIRDGVIRLIQCAAEAGCDVAVVEIADGLHHRETNTLMRDPTLREMSVGVVFAAYDSMGASVGAKMLAEMGHKVLAISGQVMRSPLAARETREASGAPLFDPMEIRAGALVEVVTGHKVELASSLAHQPLYGYRRDEERHRGLRLASDRAVVMRRLTGDDAAVFDYPAIGE